MALRRRRATGAIGSAVATGFWATPVASALLALMSIALIMISKVDQRLIDAVRGPVADIAAPVLGVMTAPVTAANNLGGDIDRYFNVYQRNAELEAEVARLRQWRDAALSLDAENRSLRALMAFDAPAPVLRTTARVIADPGGAYIRSLLVDAGSRRGVSEGQAVLAANGLAGRIVDAGAWSARVLLLTDLNSRIPVVVQESGYPAILAGDNTDRPVLLHLPQEAQIGIGDRIVTSGLEGVLPPGLAVGTVAAVEDGGVRILPAADLARLDLLQVLGYETSHPLLDGAAATAADASGQPQQGAAAEPAE